MKLRKTLALILALCVVLAACAPPSDGGGDADAPANTPTVNGDATQTVGASDEPIVVTLAESWDFSLGICPSLNPSISPNYGSIYWGRNFYNTLVSYSDDGEIVGELAESWDISDDGKMYTFHLRTDVLFSDGSPFTAEAVKVSFEAAVFNLGMYNGSYGMTSALVSNIVVADEHTVVFNLMQPYYNTLNDLTMSCPLAIVNPAAFDGDDLTYGDAFLTVSYGTGPYMYDGDFTGDTYTFVRNPYYYGEAPEVDIFKVKVIPDNDAKLLALRNGEIDAILGSQSVNADGYTELSANLSFGSRLNDKPSQTRLLGMNLAMPPP